MKKCNEFVGYVLFYYLLRTVSGIRPKQFELLVLAFMFPVFSYSVCHAVPLQQFTLVMHLNGKVQLICWFYFILLFIKNDIVLFAVFLLCFLYSYIHRIHTCMQTSHACTHRMHAYIAYLHAYIPAYTHA